MSLLKDLYCVKHISKQKKEILLASPAHPVFQAHFPKNPILPGFLQIDIAQELFDITFTQLKKVKFLHIIKPNDSVVYEHTDKKITLFNDKNKKVSEIVYA